MKTCLVVDDSRVIRKVARRLLEDLGFAVEEAEDGQSALERCRAAPLDAVIVDSYMPKMDGIAFLRALKREGLLRMPGLVFCTTENDEDHIASARAAGAQAILLKPFDRDTLEANLNYVGSLPR